MFLSVTPCISSPLSRILINIHTELGNSRINSGTNLNSEAYEINIKVFPLGTQNPLNYACIVVCSKIKELWVGEGEKLEKP